MLPQAPGPPRLGRRGRRRREGVGCHAAPARLNMGVIGDSVVIELNLALDGEVKRAQR